MKKYIEYLKDNPNHYWFKRKAFGWGWVPVKWQGWVVTAIGVAIAFGGIYIGEVDDAPGAMLLGIVIGAGIMLYFGYKKGEKPKWSWGFPKKDDDLNNS
ncbi:MAG: hypothetical protein COT81_02680 [Candidatus Buchananbacteria bacterium CG10_big_fil_rev_8_21_14_0_10_42_9]|uniref:Uncharacterized protein n=1 Tax=Candidatus Buchananbacteria bacterium CG10_big_fil_rev_8_21_14_0_10_42_9 TaxID=1974526 RepID=A0A2H0W1A8_9BACT|nr:MAG: hypothetical protein COT81_02680 [Candidatus Buchananbacteria bacterium CG10_big_fil_rev_8_21_14_0_10_42_9]